MSMQSEMVEVHTLANPNVVLIDKDTGTVLDTNVVLCYVPAHRMEEITSNDNNAREYAEMHGQNIYVDMAEATI